VAGGALRSRCQMKRAASSTATIVYVPRPGATAEEELDALANVYRFILDSHAKREAAEAASETGGRSDAAIVSDTEGVNHVEQRADRPSEVT
jgi:hypothetical protein